ncbi:MAG: hypothetical protein VB053_03435 [Oscillibacter ruminantium]|uniref:hypothetical protein n=1 Tax=Oscillibacter ruminantium TaxID=1263547 RepID=UPI002B1EDE62|nr:hypothetical protein [Oscillibacter ruminantium]MEA5041577.1 hypothetical protein [Oscillibacter ruminantium]
MKVFEIMSQLSAMPAGADVELSAEYLGVIASAGDASHVNGVITCIEKRNEELVELGGD